MDSLVVRGLSAVCLAVLAVGAPALASPALAQQASPAPACRDVAVSSDPLVITAGSTWSVGGELVNGDTRETTWRVRREIPAPEAFVRSESAPSTVQTLRMTENHRVTLNVSAPDGSCEMNVRTFDIGVRPAISIAATRNAPRNYTFSGRVLPAKGQLLTLYRHTDTGSRVITAQSRVQPDGSYRFDRRFTGSGRFGFSVATPGTSTNLAGSSATRPTVIH